MRTVLNFHRKLLAANPLTGEIQQIDLAELTAATPVLEVLDSPAPVLRFVSQTGIVKECGVPDLGPAPAFASRLATFAPAPADAPAGTFVIQSGERFLRCHPGSAVDMNAIEPAGWEWFRPLPIEIVQALAALCRYDWLVNSSGALVNAGDISIADQNQLRFGETLIALDGGIVAEPEYAVNAQGLKVPLKATLFREGWKHDRINLYNPAVVYVMFGASDDLSEQFRISTESLWRFGKYEGDIFVIGDRPEAELQALVPEKLRPRLRICARSGWDRLDHVAARLAIGDMAELNAHQPVLYTDLDVMIDAPLKPFFETMLRAEKFSAELEYFNEYSRTSCETVGKQLFEADPVIWRDAAAEANRFGFCAGIFALPGAARSGWALRIARRALAAYVEAQGRYALPGYEQSMLNYSLRHLDMYDPEPVTSRTRVASAADNLDEHEAKGFVHFWRAGHHRVPEMRKYLEKLVLRDAG